MPWPARRSPPLSVLAAAGAAAATLLAGGAALAQPATKGEPAATGAMGAAPANSRDGPAARSATATSIACPDKNILYWQAFPPGGESDLSARHQQLVLKKKCPAIDTIIQYKAGAGGAVLWNQMNTMPADGQNIMGINLPHIVFQPIDGQVQYKTEDIVPVYWFHYTPDALVVPLSLIHI